MQFETATDDETESETTDAVSPGSSCYGECKEMLMPGDQYAP